MADRSVTVTWPDDIITPSTATPGSVVVSVSGGAAGTSIPAASVDPSATSATVTVPEELPTDPPYVASVQMFDNASPANAIGLPGVTDPFQVLAPPSVNTPGKPSVVVS